MDCVYWAIGSQGLMTSLMLERSLGVETASSGVHPMFKTNYQCRCIFWLKVLCSILRIMLCKYRKTVAGVSYLALHVWLAIQDNNPLSHYLLSSCTSWCLFVSWNVSVSFKFFFFTELQVWRWEKLISLTVGTFLIFLIFDLCFRHYMLVWERKHQNMLSFSPAISHYVSTKEGKAVLQWNNAASVLNVLRQ